MTSELFAIGWMADAQYSIAPGATSRARDSRARAVSVSRRMLSYQHAYHAGNHADVLKHAVLAAALTRLAAKPKALRYVETHAGAGGYDLRAAAAQKNREHERGIARVWPATEAPAAVARLLTLVRRYNDDRGLVRYPGSPWLAQQCLRAQDDLHLFELHPAEHAALERNCARDRRVEVRRADGLVGCIGLVPPPERRGLVLIDPSYERRDEADEVLDAVAKLHRRFATGVLLIWYPLIERSWVERFERRLRGVCARVSTYELTVAAAGGARGLLGSGVFAVNPPWQLDDELEAALPWLAAKLGDENARAWRLVGGDDSAGRGSR
jgi:23S rRNA (adenine2030-N6)-methyltransferase